MKDNDSSLQFGWRVGGWAFRKLGFSEQTSCQADVGTRPLGEPLLPPPSVGRVSPDSRLGSLGWFGSVQPLLGQPVEPQRLDEVGLVVLLKVPPSPEGSSGDGCAVSVSSAMHEFVHSQHKL